MSSRLVSPLSRLVAWAHTGPTDDGAEGRPRTSATVARRRYHRALLLVLAVWAVLTCATAVVLPVAALGVAAIGLAHLLAGHHVEQQRRTREGTRPPARA